MSEEPKVRETDPYSETRRFFPKDIDPLSERDFEFNATLDDANFKRDIKKYGSQSSYRKVLRDLMNLMADLEADCDFSGEIDRLKVLKKFSLLAFAPWSKTIAMPQILREQVKALELVGKHFKMWSEKVEIDGDVDLAQKMREALGRVARIAKGKG